MRLLLSLSAAAVFAILTLAACNSSDTNGNRAGSNSNNAGARGNSAASVPSATPGHVAPSDGIKRVTTVELRDALANGTAIVVDVRGATVYQQSHIKDSISIPLEQTAAHLQELPRDKMIVTYCS